MHLLGGGDHPDSTSLADIAVQRRDLTERARSGKLKPADLADGTFTIQRSDVNEVIVRAQAPDPRHSGDKVFPSSGLHIFP